MSLAQSVLAINDDLPIRTNLPVHSGKVRSVYWLTEEDSARLIAQKGYNAAPDAPLAIMVISDRLSAFDCIWHGEEGLQGVPGKGAALNAISNFWFKLFKQRGLANSHILDVPHPLVWIVQKARPIKIEAICRRYITGSMWRAYEKGERVFCGITLPEGLQQNQRLDDLLMTPSTKGILKGIDGVPEVDDVNITRDNIEQNYNAFGFNSPSDINVYEKLLQSGFDLIEKSLENLDEIFVDTKFEFGYIKDKTGQDQLIYMDEVGTPDSSRIWDKHAYAANKVVEKSKEQFRQAILNHASDADILLNKDRMAEREAMANNTALPSEFFTNLSKTYLDIAQTITGSKINLPQNPKDEIIHVLKTRFGLID